MRVGVPKSEKIASLPKHRANTDAVRLWVAPRLNIQYSVLMPDGVYLVLCVGSRHVMYALYVYVRV